MAYTTATGFGNILKWLGVLVASLVAVTGLVLALNRGDSTVIFQPDITPSTPEIGLSEAQIVAIASRIRQQLEHSNSSHSEAIPGGSIDAQIKDYLLRHPEILISMSQALEQRQQQESQQQIEQFLQLNQQVVYYSNHDVVVGNPNGDVTLVEFFDYNCGFCQQVLPEIIALLEDDKNLRVVLKEFPSLSAESVEAARIAYLVGQSGKDYLSFHTDLMTARGVKDLQKALDLATKMGLDAAELKARMNDETVSHVLEQTDALAQQLGIRGTPAFIIGNEVLIGYIDRDALKKMISNIRSCGRSECAEQQDLN